VTDTHTHAQTTTAATRRNKRRWWIGGAMVGVLAVVAALIGVSHSSPPSPPPASLGTMLDRPLPPEIVNLPLVDDNGRPTSLAALRGRAVVLTDFLTLCQEVCPITMSQLNRVAGSVEHNHKIVFLGITVDPQRDTPQRLHAYRSFAGLSANWQLWTATPQHIAALWKFFGAYYAKAPEEQPPGIDWMTGQPLTYDVTHQDVLVFLDGSLHERFVIQGPPVGTGAPLTAGERNFLNDEGRANLTNTADATWTPADALRVLSWLTGHRFSLRS
jgi:cytochrome oxidase Cu insertion factor (SCO1/SenC/PrrC family)